MYPSDWPKCDCGRPALDGHLTCGDARCGTQAEAEAKKRLAARGSRLGKEELRTRPTVKVGTLPDVSIAALRAATASRVSEGAARLFRGECVLCGSTEHRTSACPETP